MRLIAILALVCSVCNAQTLTPLPPWNAQTQDAWWAAHPDTEQWPAAVDELKNQLADSYARGGITSLSDANFTGWLHHVQWIQTGLDAGPLLKDPAGLKVFATLGRMETVSHLFVQKIQPGDKIPAALAILFRFQQEAPSDLADFPALSVAYSLVFDQPFPRNWPHGQVAAASVPTGDMDVLLRFQYHVQASRNKKTVFDLSQLKFEDLKFLIDTPLQFAELDYGAKNHISRSRFEDAFSSIRYDIERLKKQVFVWPHPEYHLKDIEQFGGICVDQAYYAAMVGKARGIPTLYFHGQGSDGGHAWFGYLEHAGKWQTDCGRYASQNYPVGYAIDPQTWTVINDATLETLFKNGVLNANYAPAKAALAWYSINPKLEARRQILEDARTLMPSLGEAWEIESTWMESTDMDVEVRKKFYRDWIQQFTYNRDLKVKGQEHLLALLKQAGDPEAEKLQQSIITENRRKRFDLGIKAGVGPLMEKLEAKDWKGADLEYKQLVRKFDLQGGGNLFYQIVLPYVTACLEEQQLSQAADGLKYAEKRMPLGSDSIIGHEFEQLSERIRTAKAQTH